MLLCVAKILDMLEADDLDLLCHHDRGGLRDAGEDVAEMSGDSDDGCCFGGCELFVFFIVGYFFCTNKLDRVS